MEEVVDKGKKRTSSVLDIKEEEEKISKFGSRVLKEENDVFSQNAWYDINLSLQKKGDKKEKLK